MKSNIKSTGGIMRKKFEFELWRFLLYLVGAAICGMVGMTVTIAGDIDEIENRQINIDTRLTKVEEAIATWNEVNNLLLETNELLTRLIEQEKE